MARERTAAQWEGLSAPYRDRLQRNGITRHDYLSGVKLSRARGQTNESVHKRQQKLVREYGPKQDDRKTSEITPAMLRKARKEHGDAWVTARLAQMKADYNRSAHGEFPHGGDKPVGRRSAAEQEYGVMATKSYNYYAPFWWYRGAFGRHGPVTGGITSLTYGSESQNSYCGRRSDSHRTRRRGW